MSSPITPERFATSKSATFLYKSLAGKMAAIVAMEQPYRAHRDYCDHLDGEVRQNRHPHEESVTISPAGALTLNAPISKE